MKVDSFTDLDVYKTSNGRNYHLLVDTSQLNCQPHAHLWTKQGILPFTSTSHQSKDMQAGCIVRQTTFMESQGFCLSGILWPLAHNVKLVHSQNKMTDYQIHSLCCHACAPVQHL